MSKSYDDLGHCQVGKCLADASKLILKTVGEEPVLIAYCSFHAVVAETFFGKGNNRTEIKGITPC